MELLEILNPWWKEGKVGGELAFSYKRKMFPKLKRLMKERQITVLSGLRRVGKSTLMYQLIQSLLESGTDAQKVLYFSFDEKTEELLKVLEQYSEITKVDWKNEKCFVFFDEIQKLDGWADKLKLVYDRFPNLKITISGSSSFELEKQGGISLAGRHFLVGVQPLGFDEYLELKASEIDLGKPQLWRDEIRKEFENYLLKPFPEIINTQDFGLVKSYLKQNVIEKILKADLTEKFGRVNESLLNSLIDIFYGRPGTYLNYDELSKDLKVSKKTLIKHVYYLEFAYLLRIVKNYRPNTRTSSRKLQRAYPFHFSLRVGWNGKIDLETVVATFLNAKHYWRENGKEVDFISHGKEILPVEVKEGESVTKTDFGPMLFFLKKFKLKNGLLVYKGEEGTEVKQNLRIKKMPVWRFFLDFKPKNEG